MPIILNEIDAAAWAELEKAVSEPASAFRYLTFCSVDEQGKPQARTIVLRRADKLMRVMEFHTDTRSLKWQEIAANPYVTVLGYCAQTRLQLRLQGRVEPYDAESDVAQAIWSRLPAHTQKTYAGGPPGGARACDDIKAISAAEEAEGKANFGVLIVHASSLDWYQLHKEQNQRAFFTYDNSGALVDSQWVNP